MSTHPESAEAIFPRAYGNEEETGVMVDYGRGLEEPYEFTRSYADHLPRRLRIADSFVSNGTRIYPGGCDEEDVIEPTNLERSTPECSTLEQITTHIRANEQLLVELAQNYANEASQDASEPVHMRLHRRVVDSKGNRKGCHDSFDVDPDISETNSGDIILPAAVLGHLATRSFVTGAGYIKRDRLRFSQKVGGLTDTHGYGYYGSHYRSTTQEGSHRLEIRSNDVNISDWATRMRIGSSALALAIASTDLKHELPVLSSHNGAAVEAKQRNSFTMQRDGMIDDNPKLRESISYQRQLAELALFELPNYLGEEIPEEHQITAEELLVYCNDMTKVLDQKASLELLADRADWAAKMQLVIDKALIHPQTKGLEDVTGWDAQARDMLYDYIGVRATNGIPQRTKYGDGYKLRKNHTFRNTISEDAVAHALHKPPKTTRAHLRARIIAREDNIRYCNWDEVQYVDANNRLIVVKMPDVRASHMDDTYISSSDIKQSPRI